MSFYLKISDELLEKEINDVQTSIKSMSDDVDRLWGSVMVLSVTWIAVLYLFFYLLDKLTSWTKIPSLILIVLFEILLSLTLALALEKLNKTTEDLKKLTGYLVNYTKESERRKQERYGR